MAIHIYTDGSTKNNKMSKKENVLGGIGVYCEEWNLEISESFENATNNRAELRAIKRALEVVKDRKFSEEVVIFSDSRYSINACTLWYLKWLKNGWLTAGKKPVENKALIMEVITLLGELPNVKLEYVKGHSVSVGNQKADALAGSVYLAELNAMIKQ